MVRVRSVPASFRADYAQIAREILMDGVYASPRGTGTYEMMNYILFLDDARKGTFVNGIGRKVSPRVLAAELMQWVGGFSDLAQLQHVSSFFAKISDDGERLYGAYGPRTYHGFARAVNVLADDLDSRQATVSIWNNQEVISTADLPCTVSWSFVVRNDQLHMTTFMRSNDIWLGSSYDIPIMCRIQTMLAWALGVEVGSYTHHALSMHVYERDIEGVQALSHPSSDVEEPPFFDAVDFPARQPDKLANWRQIREWAVEAYLGHQDLPHAFQWYSDRLRDTKRNRHFCTHCRYVTSEPCQLH